MAFQNSTNFQTVVCSSCQGQGCSECGNFGVYGITPDKTVTFNLPPYLNLHKRSSAKIKFLIKRGILFFIVLVLITTFWKLINNF